MKKLLLATMAATMMSTVAMADVTYDVNSYDYEVGRIHKGMQLANHFENRNINIVENGQGQLAASMTVNAWNDAWDDTENNNTVDVFRNWDSSTRDRAEYTPNIERDQYVVNYTPAGARESIPVDLIRFHVSDEEVQVIQINGAPRSFESWANRVEGAIANTYDIAFEDGYTAGYNDGFAAAKGVVKNGD